MSAGDTNIAAAEALPPPPEAKAPPIPRPRDVRRWLVLAAVVAVAVVSLFPIASTLFLSLRQEPSGFEALAADPRFWEALRRTAIFASIALPAELVLGLTLAGIFLGRMPGKTIFVYLLALPALVAPIIGGVTWRMLFDNDYGPVNHVLGGVLGGAVTTLWTTDPDYAYATILVADVWQWTPFVFVLMLAALTNVDRGQLETAAINDAGPWRTLRRVVLPAIWPAIAIAILIRGLDFLRLFDAVWALTRGGPEGETETISVLAYERLVAGADAGSSAAMAFASLVIVSVVATLGLLRLGQPR
ncbi:MAG: carbohydrate ABC transporter permease [Propylenella sp.]